MRKKKQTKEQLVLARIFEREDTHQDTKQTRRMVLTDREAQSIINNRRRAARYIARYGKAQWYGLYVQKKGPGRYKRWLARRKQHNKVGQKLDKGVMATVTME